MMYHQDWIMRQIEVMIDAIVQFCLPHSQRNSSSDEGNSFYVEQLSELISKSNFHKAKAYADSFIGYSDVTYLSLIVRFYSDLNSFSDQTLEENDYPRTEILSELKDICKARGLDTILGL